MNYWQLMRRHLIMGCDSKVNIFCRYWVWAAISFKLYAIQQQWLHAYNYGQSTGRGLSARSFGYAWLMHIISAVAELLLTSFPCNMVMMYSNHEASVCLGQTGKCYSTWENGRNVNKLTHDGGHASKTVLGVKVEFKGHVIWALTCFYEKRYSYNELMLTKYAHNGL